MDGSVTSVAGAPADSARVTPVSLADATRWRLGRVADHPALPAVLGGLLCTIGIALAGHAAWMRAAGVADARAAAAVVGPVDAATPDLREPLAATLASDSPGAVGSRRMPPRQPEVARPMSRAELSQAIWRAGQRSGVVIQDVALDADASGGAAAGFGARADAGTTSAAASADAAAIGLTASIGARGSYARVKQFVAEVLNPYPGVALAALTLSRRDGSTDVDAQMALRVPSRAPAAQRQP
jgi:hypothetical protein